MSDNNSQNIKRYCPLCKQRLSIRKDLLFCSSCNVFIGNPETFDVSFGVHSHYYHYDHNDMINTREEKEETISHVFFNFTVIFIFIVVFLFLGVQYFYKPYVLKNTVNINDIGIDINIKN